MTWRILLLTLLMSAPAAALERYRLNDNDEDAQIFNKAYLECTTTRACINVTIHPDHPEERANGDVWIRDDGDTLHTVCFRSGGLDYCVDAVEE